MRVLICYATTEGQTRKIADFIADIVRKHSHEPAVFDATAVSELEPSRCGAAILAGSVHMGRYQAALVHHIHRWREQLNAMPSAFVSVSMSAASDDSHDRAEVDELCQKMLREAGWTPRMTLHAAGAMRFSEYDFFKRWIARMVARQMRRDSTAGAEQEYTDWTAVADFADRFMKLLPAK